MEIGFIGAGKVGFTLGKYFSIKGLHVAGYFSRNLADAKEASGFTKADYFTSLEGIVCKSDMIFVTVPDAEIEQVWMALKNINIEGKYICHCSGALSSEVFSDIAHYGAYGYSVHPLCAIHDKVHSYMNLDNVYFTVEGDEKNLENVLNLIRSLGNNTEIISKDKKELYHAASVMVSNLTIALAQISSELFSECGLSKEFSEKAWNSLFLGNVTNVCQSGTASALTGPLERNDIETVRKHISCLDGDNKEIYLKLSKVILKIAKSRHPERDYSVLEKELNHEKHCNYSKTAKG